MSTTPITSPNVYRAAIASVETALQDNQLSQSERDEVEKQLRAVGIDTAFLGQTSPAVMAELRRTLDLLQRLDAGSSLQTLAGVGSLDLSTTVMSVQLGRANLLEDDLRLQMEQMQERNRDMEELSNIRTQLTALRPSDGQTVTLTADMLSRLAALGVTADATLTGAQVDSLNGTIAAKVESLGATQQMEMIRTQSLANKRNEAFETVTNLLSQFNKTKESIIGNLR
jgi:alkylhydroperoxidase family enzyme